MRLWFADLMNITEEGTFIDPTFRGVSKRWVYEL